VGDLGWTHIRLQAAAEKVIVEKPSPASAVVRAVREDGQSWSSPEASLIPGEHNYLPDVLARGSAAFSVLLRQPGIPVDLTPMAPGEYPLTPQFAPFLLHTGMISRALLATADHLAAVGHEAFDSAISANDLIDAAERALRAHDDEIRFRCGRPWYITPDDFPSRRLGLELPHNHVVDAATSFLLLGKLRPDANLVDLGTSLTRRFMAEVHAYRDGTLRHPWFYYPVDSDVFAGVKRAEPLAERCVTAVPRAEDSSHATLRVRALGEWKAIADDVATDEDMNEIALSFRRFFMTRNDKMPTLRWLPGDTTSSLRRGQADTYIGAWGALTPWDPSLRRRINAMAFHHAPQSLFGATVLSAAEVLALNVGLPTHGLARKSWDKNSQSH